MDSFQFGALAFFWIFSRWHIIKVFPFLYYSTMHTSEFVKSKLEPGSSLAARIEKFQNVDSVKLGQVVSYVDVLIFLRLFLDVITFRKGSFFSLLVFGFFYRIRVAYSAQTYKTLNQLVSNIDTFMNGPKVPAKVKQIWTQVKETTSSQESATLDPSIARERAEQIRKMREQDAEEAKLAQEKFEKAR